MESSEVYLILFTVIGILALVFWPRKKTKQEEETFEGQATLVYKLKGCQHKNEWLCEFSMNGEIRTGTIFVQNEECQIGDTIRAEFSGHYGQGLPWLFNSE